MRRILLRWASLLVLALLPFWPAFAQTPPATAPEPATPAQRGEEDPLGRSAPHGTVAGFLRATHGKDYARAAEYLDTDKPEAAAEELARQLQVVLDRGLRVDLDRLSRKSEGDPQDGFPTTRDRVGTVDTPSGKLEILLERLDRGGQRPIWLFSSETLRLVPAAAEELGAFNVEAYVPRPLVDVTILSFPLYRWLGTALGLALALGLSALLARALVPLLRHVLRRTTGEEADRTLVSIRAPIRLVLVAITIRLLSALSGSLEVRQLWTRVAFTLGVIGLTWLVIRLSDLASALGTRGLRRRGITGKIAMWNLVQRLFKAIVVVTAALLLLHRAGMDLTAVLTGLGIGGLALALAAQKTLENLFGGVMIVTDEPMRVGDFCRVGDQTGTIEDIGLRSTRIRTQARTVVAIPNGQLAVMSVENFSVRDKFWFRHQIGVRCETSADQLRYLLVEIRAMLYSHPKVERDDARTRFVGFGGSSLDLEIFAYVKAADTAEFLGIQEDLLLRVMDLLAKAGTGIAFPAQMTYLAQDTPIDAQKAAEAATQVGQWREQGKLPFPDFHPDEVGRLRDRIEYPPPGSALWSKPGDPGGK